MKEVWVTGIGLCSALGPTLHQSWSALVEGKSGIQIQQPFATQPPVPLALVGSQSASLNLLLEQALSDLVKTSEAPLTQVQGVVVGSSRGYQGELEQVSHGWRQDAQFPTNPSWDWIYSQSPATYIARRISEKTWSGPVLAPRAACATGLWAIAQGIDLIQSGSCNVVIAGAAEAPITPLTVAGFRRMGALASEGAYPFDQRRTGLVLGEGAALLRLESAETALQRGAPSYGRVLGFGLTNDAHHVNAPSQNQASAVEAILSCMSRSGLRPEQVDYIHAHGTATHLNDGAEAHLIQTLFPARPAVSSTKGATGHTLGASGAIGAVFCLMALRSQRYPPCTGLLQPAYDLNFVKPFSESIHPASFQNALCLSFGFGGQNAAVAFAAP